MSLESRYRRLLRIYPRAYRERRGDEMLATLLESAGPDQTRPSRRDVADLLSGAARERLGLHAVPAAGQGLRIATPFLLVIAASFATSDWLAGPPSPLSTVVAVAWLLAILVPLVWARTGVTAVGLAVVTTIAAGIAAALSSTAVSDGSRGVVFNTAEGRLTLTFLCGLIGWVGLVLAPREPAVGPRLLSPHHQRVIMAVAVLGLTVSAAVTNGVNRQPGPDDGRYLPYPSWTFFLWAVPIVLALAGLVVRIRRQHNSWLWAALFLLIPAAATTPVSALMLMGYDSRIGILMVIDLGGPGLALVVGAMVAVTVLLSARNNTRDIPATDGQQPPRPSSPGLAALTTAGALTQAAVIAVGLFLFAAAAYDGAISADFVLIAVGTVAAGLALFTPDWAHRPLIGVGLVATVAALYTGRAGIIGFEVILTIVAMLLVVLATWRRPDPAGSDHDARLARRSRRRTAGLAILPTAAIVAALTWYATGTLFADADAGYLYAVVAPAAIGVLLIPTAYWATMVVIRSRRGWIGAAVAQIAALAWVTPALVGLTDSRLIAAVVALVIIATLGLRRIWRGARTPATVI